MKTYRFDIEVTGYVTLEVTAESNVAARSKAEEAFWDTYGERPVSELSTKSLDLYLMDVREAPEIPASKLRPAKEVFDTATVDGVRYELIHPAKGYPTGCTGCVAYSTVDGTLCERLPRTCFDEERSAWVLAKAQP